MNNDGHNVLAGGSNLPHGNPAIPQCGTKLQGSITTCPLNAVHVFELKSRPCERIARPPSPRPAPPGEGESLSASLKYYDSSGRIDFGANGSPAIDACKAQVMTAHSKGWNLGRATWGVFRSATSPRPAPPFYKWRRGCQGLARAATFRALANWRALDRSCKLLLLNEN